MNDYICLTIKTKPASEDIYDLFASYLADAGFESFTQEADALKAYCKKEIFTQASVEEIIAEFPIPLESVETLQESIEGKDWNEEWEKNYFQPIIVGGECVVHSTFHKDVPVCKYDIVIDPRMAFGTGHHSTTSMMLTHLLELDLSGKTVIDMGTGTGILAILSKKRGALNVTGIEIDGFAWENSLDNARLNDSDITLLHGDATALDSLEPADIFLANINRNIILNDLDKYVSRLKKEGKLIVSGFYEKDIPILESAAARFGMKIANIKTDKDWASVVFEF